MLNTKLTQRLLRGARYKEPFSLAFLEGRLDAKRSLQSMNDVLQTYVDEMILTVRRRFYFHEDAGPFISLRSCKLVT